MVTTYVRTYVRIFLRVQGTLRQILNRQCADLRVAGLAYLSGFEDPKGFRWMLRASRGNRLMLADLFAAMAPATTRTDALKEIVIVMRQVFPDYTQLAKVYSIGYQSLAQCYPNQGFEWMRHNREEAMHHVPEVVSTFSGSPVRYWADCLQLQCDKSKVPYGHLGMHPQNMGVMMGDGRNDGGG